MKPSDAYVGTTVWYMSAGWQTGQITKIICVCADGGLMVNVKTADGTELRSLLENVEFFWEKPVTPRPKVLQNRGLFVQVWKHRDGGIQLKGEAGSVVIPAESPCQLPKAPASNAIWENLGIQKITIKE